jgi:hypothetical protein
MFIACANSIQPKFDLSVNVFAINISPLRVCKTITLSKALRPARAIPL